MATGLGNPTLRLPEEPGEKTSRCLVAPLHEGLDGHAVGVIPGLDKQPELVGVTGVTGGHGWFFVLRYQAGARS